ncbi:hypothetical protein GCM10011578_051240 [Streptomyces fuscichromogenes]|uniref:Uncharacterized protein n=1 Tax=Streptomyces fuscichromogenes TaxID=1324013 RepID=A0A917XGT8_9ACTN|nr:hypothetical protein GCM10011578_051240 [Streptomyces fuscichromogenes]
MTAGGDLIVHRVGPARLHTDTDLSRAGFGDRKVGRAEGVRFAGAVQDQGRHGERLSPAAVSR